MAVFLPRNFGEDALANTIQGMRFDLEIVRHFHPDAHDPALYRAGRELSRRLALDSVASLRRLMEQVERGAPAATDAPLVDELSRHSRAVEAQVRAEMIALAAQLHQRVGRGLPLTYLGDRVATPLQRAISTAGLNP
jgi:hypothetical protein